MYTEELGVSMLAPWEHPVDDAGGRGVLWVLTAMHAEGVVGCRLHGRSVHRSFSMLGCWGGARTKINGVVARLSLSEPPRALI